MTLGPLQILLAEDDAVCRYVVGRTLRKHGYNVLEAEDGMVAEQVLERRCFGAGRVARIDAGFETGLVAASDAGVWVAAAGGAELTRNGLARIDPAANRATVVEVEGQVTEITADGNGVWVGIREPDAAFHLAA